MTTEQFTKVQDLLKSNFPFARFFENADSMNILFNSLNRFEWKDIWPAVVGIVENGISGQMGMDTIIRAVESVYTDRKIAESSRNRERTVKCPRCNDTGYILIHYPEKRAADAIRACSCVVGHDKFPWYFMTEEEWDAYYSYMHKKGQNPQRPYISSDADRRRYCYGE